MSKNIVKLKPVEAIGATEKEFELEGDLPSPSSSSIRATQLVPELVDGSIDTDYDGYVLKRYKPNKTGFNSEDGECSFKESYTIEELKEKFGLMFKEVGSTCGIITCGKLSIEVYIDSVDKDQSEYSIDLYIYLDYPDNKIEYNYYSSDSEDPWWGKWNHDIDDYEDCEAPKINPTLLNMDFEDYSVSGCFAIPSQIGFFLIDPHSEEGEEYEVYQSSDTSYGWLKLDDSAGYIIDDELDDSVATKYYDEFTYSDIDPEAIYEIMVYGTNDHEEANAYLYCKIPGSMLIKANKSDIIVNRELRIQINDNRIIISANNGSDLMSYIKHFTFKKI